MGVATVALVREAGSDHGGRFSFNLRVYEIVTEGAVWQ